MKLIEEILESIQPSPEEQQFMIDECKNLYECETCSKIYIDTTYMKLTICEKCRLIALKRWLKPRLLHS